MYMNHVIFNTVSRIVTSFVEWVPHPYIILMMCKYCCAIVLNNDEYFVCMSHGFLHHSPSFLSAWKIWCLTLGDIQKVRKSPGWKRASNCKQVCSRAGGRGESFDHGLPTQNSIYFIISLIHLRNIKKLLNWKRSWLKVWKDVPYTCEARYFHKKTGRSSNFLRSSIKYLPL